MKIDLKNIAICVLFVALVVAILFSLFKSSESNDRQREVVRAELERDQARAAESEALASLKQVRDSLEIAYTVASNARIDVTRAKIETEKARKQLKEVVFIHYRGDKERDSVLRALYPSLNQPH